MKNGTANRRDLSILVKTIKGRVHCFSTQVERNKCFLLNPEENWHRSVLSFSRKTQKHL